MRVVVEGVHELLQALVDHRVVGDVIHPLVVLFPIGQLAVEQQIRDLGVRALLRELLDRVAAVLKDALVAVDERDPALAGGRIHERRVVGHQSEVVGPGLDLPQVDRANRAVGDREFVRLARAPVDHRESVFLLGECDSGGFFLLSF